MTVGHQTARTVNSQQHTLDSIVLLSLFNLRQPSRRERRHDGAGETDHRFDSWGPLLVPDGVDNSNFERIRDALCALIAMIEKSLSARDFSFRPLLPPDTDPIADRTKAMAQWCHGFGMGLHWNGLVNSDSLEADAKDAITDLAQFAQVDAAGAQSDDESALIELEEYLKVVAQLVFEAVEVVIPTHRVQ